MNFRNESNWLLKWMKKFIRELNAVGYSCRYSFFLHPFYFILSKHSISIHSGSNSLRRGKNELRNGLRRTNRNQWRRKLIMERAQLTPAANATINFFWNMRAASGNCWVNDNEWNNYSERSRPALIIQSISFVPLITFLEFLSLLAAGRNWLNVIHSLRALAAFRSFIQFNCFWFMIRFANYCCAPISLSICCFLLRFASATNGVNWKQ